MSSSYDLYKGMSRSKRKNKTPGESSQQPLKKSRVVEPSVARESTSTVPVVEPSEAPSSIPSPPAPVVEEPEVVVQDEPLPTEELVAEESREAAIERTIEEVAGLARERLDKLVQSHKFLKASTSFPSYGSTQAFVRGTNDISSVSTSSLHSLTGFCQWFTFF